MRKPKLCGYGLRPSQTYSPKEIADRLGNAESTVREWIRDGKLPAMTSGKPDIFISPSAGIMNRGLSRLHYKTNDCLRRVIKDAFKAAGLPPYTAHRFRNIAVATSNGYVTTAEEL